MPEPSITRLVASATIEPNPAEHRVEAGIDLWVELRGGRRVRADGRGFAAVLHGDFVPGAVPPVTEEDIRNCLIPDDDADPEPLPWAWLVERLAGKGFVTTVEALRAVPYEVEFFAGDTWLYPTPED